MSEHRNWREELSDHVKRYFPVGLAFTWGSRELVYVIEEHRMSEGRVRYRYTSYYTDVRTERKRGWLAYDDIRDWIDSSRAIVAPSLEEFWQKLETESEEADLE